MKKNTISQTKQGKELLFSYGTLQLKKVQIETYNRELQGIHDTLVGYKLENLHITDLSVVEKSNQKFHPIAIKTTSSADRIEGKIFELTSKELSATDLYEVDDYKRVLETFESEVKAWVYIKNNQCNTK